jgi:hypothetical protein
LRVSHFFESDAHGDGVLAVVEHATGFSFSGGSNDDFEDGAVGVNGAVVGGLGVGCERAAVGVSGSTAQEKMASDAAACVAFAEVGGIRMDVEHHVGAAAFKFGVGMGSDCRPSFSGGATGIAATQAILKSGGDVVADSGAFADGATMGAPAMGPAALAWERLESSSTFIGLLLITVSVAVSVAVSVGLLGGSGGSELGGELKDLGGLGAVGGAKIGHLGLEEAEFFGVGGEGIHHKLIGLETTVAGSLALGSVLGVGCEVGTGENPGFIGGRFHAPVAACAFHEVALVDEVVESVALLDVGEGGTGSS